LISEVIAENFEVPWKVEAQNLFRTFFSPIFR
jgi:hypothetical protein